MPEPTLVELFLKIERLEKELQAAKQLEVGLKQAEIAIEEKDRQIANLHKAIQKEELNAQRHQEIIDNQRNMLENQNTDINTLSSEVKRFKESLQKASESLTLACSQRDNSAKQVAYYKELANESVNLKKELTLHKNALTKTLEALQSTTQFQMSMIEEIQSFLNK